MFLSAVEIYLINKEFSIERRVENYLQMSTLLLKNIFSTVAPQNNT